MGVFRKYNSSYTRHGYLNSMVILAEMTTAIVRRTVLIQEQKALDRTDLSSVRFQQ